MVALVADGLTNTQLRLLLLVRFFLPALEHDLASLAQLLLGEELALEIHPHNLDARPEVLPRHTPTSIEQVEVLSELLVEHLELLSQPIVLPLEIVHTSLETLDAILLRLTLQI